MKKCPICGENYSDTYRDCPFCEEEDAMRDGNEIRRNNGNRVSHGRSYSLMTPTLIVLILIMVALLVWLLYGGEKKEDQTTKPPIEQETQKPNEKEDEQQGGNAITPVDPSQSGTMPEDPGTTTPTNPVEPEKPDNKTAFETANKLPDGLPDVMNREDFTLAGAGDSWNLKKSGVTGSFTWISKDESIAKVDSNGNVVGISGGSTTILVTDGSRKATCIVRVKGSAASTGNENVATNVHELNRDDFTIKVGESFRLRVSGITTGLTWSIGKPSVATISENGTVTGVSKGQTTVTVTWDGGSDTCIVRVSG